MTMYAIMWTQGDSQFVILSSIGVLTQQSNGVYLFIKVVVSIRNTIFWDYWLVIFSHLISDGEIEWHQVDIVLSFEFELLGR